MKKSISINLSGILFHIEEDAYERLNQYLNEIKAYFNRIDGSGEVVQDIESRMAEVFSQKVGPAKQVITMLDVEQLTAQLGSVQDFAAAYADEPLEDTSYVPPYTSTSQTYTAADPESKKLYRDASHKILGGVASGMARYLKIDAIWIRLLLIIVMFDFFITFSFSTLTFITYIVLWIVLPEKIFANDEPGKEKTKKMYRNPDNKVIGGVAGGLGAFFGTDPTLLRIFFVILFFVGGGGLLLYIILWVIMPEARTITEKMRMQGEPVTLSNIEHQVKKKLNLPESEEESVLTRILLFPFRVISAIFSGGTSGASSVASTLGRLVRIVAGLILTFIGFALLIALIIAILALSGAYPNVAINLFDTGLPLSWIQQVLPGILWVAVATLLIIPALFIFLSGIAFLASGWRIPREFGWGLAGLWLIALIVTIFMAPKVVSKFAAEGYHDTTLTLNNPNPTQILELEINEKRFGNLATIHKDNLKLTIHGTTDSVITIEQRATARSESSELAQEMAASIEVPIVQEGNTIKFSDRLAYNADGPYAIQEAEMVMYMPNGQRFSMSRSMARILKSTLYPFDYGVRDLGKTNIFYFDENSDLVCENCNGREREERKTNRTRNRKNTGGSWDLSNENHTTINDFKNYSELVIGGGINAVISQKENYGFGFSGNKLAYNDLKIEQYGNKLEINRSLRWNDRDKDDDELVLFISLPELKSLIISGASTVELIIEQEDLNITLEGASELTGTVELDNLKLRISGASDINLKGEARRLQARVTGGSELHAKELRTQTTDIELATASEAEVFASELLEGEVSHGSELLYSGSPKENHVSKNSGGEVTRN